MRSDSSQVRGELQRSQRADPGDVRRRALRALVIMAIASSPLIWIKLRLVTGIPRMAYAAEVGALQTPEGAGEGEALVARVD